MLLNECYLSRTFLPECLPGLGFWLVCVVVGTTLHSPSTHIRRWRQIAAKMTRGERENRIRSSNSNGKEVTRWGGEVSPTAIFSICQRTFLTVRFRFFKIGSSICGWGSRIDQEAPSGLRPSYFVSRFSHSSLARQGPRCQSPVLITLTTNLKNKKWFAQK